MGTDLLGDLSHRVLREIEPEELCVVGSAEREQVDGHRLARIDADACADDQVGMRRATLEFLALHLRHTAAYSDDHVRAGAL